MVRAGAIGPEAVVQPSELFTPIVLPPIKAKTRCADEITKHMLAQSILRMCLHALLSTTKSQKGGAMLQRFVFASQKTLRLYYKDQSTFRKPTDRMTD